MASNSSIFNFSRCPWAVILTLVLLFMCELGVRHYYNQILNFSDKTILYKKDVIERREGHPFNALIIGDSRMLGVDAAEISRVISSAGQREIELYNLSLPNPGVQSHYFLLRKYLRHNPPPDFIVFSVSIDNWAGSGNYLDESSSMFSGLHRFCLMFSLRDCYEAFPLKFFYKALVGKAERCSFLLTYRRMTRERLKKIGQAFVPDPLMENLTNGRNGGIRYAMGDPPSGDDFRASFPYTMTFKPDPESVLWHERFILLAQQHGIRLILVHPPEANLVFEHRQDNGENQRYRDFFEQFCRRFPAVTVAPPVMEGYDRSLFRDAHHLNREGFRRFSAELGQRLAEILVRDLGQP